MPEGLDGNTLVLAGVIAFLVIRDLRAWNLESEEREKRETLYMRMGELHEWHDVRDEDGVHVWYIRRSLEKSMSNVAVCLEASRVTQSQQTALLTGAVKTLERMDARLDRLESKIK